MASSAAPEAVAAGDVHKRHTVGLDGSLLEVALAAIVAPIDAGVNYITVP